MVFYDTSFWWFILDDAAWFYLLTLQDHRRTLVMP